MFYPFALVASSVFLALSPLSVLLKFCGCHSMDRKDDSTSMVNPEDHDEVEIFFTTAGGGMITLEFSVWNTVQEVLPKVQDNLGFDFVKSHIHLELNGEQLDESEAVTLAQYGIRSGDSLQVVVEPAEVEIRVKLEDDTLIFIKLSPRDTVSLLMDELAKQTGIGKENQFLLVSGERIVDWNMRVGRIKGTEELELFPLQMTLRISLPDKRVALATVDRDASYEDLKYTIARIAKTTEHFVRLIYNGVELEDGPMLHSQGLRSNSQLKCEKEVDIVVRLQNGEKVTVRMNVESTTKALKAELESLTGIPADSQFLVLKGSELYPRRTLIWVDGELELWSATIVVHIKLSDGQTRTFRCRRGARYFPLYTRILRLEKTRGDLLRIHLDGKKLPLRGTLHLLGFRNNSTLVCKRIVRVTVSFRTAREATRQEFKIDSQATMRVLKLYIHGRTDTSFRTHVLIFANELVTDDEKRMGDFSRTGFTVYVYPAMLNISVVNKNTGKTLQLSIRPTATLRELRERVSELFGLNLNELRLYFPRLQTRIGRKDTRTLPELGVRDGDIVEAYTTESAEDGEVAELQQQVENEPKSHGKNTKSEVEGSAGTRRLSENQKSTAIQEHPRVKRSRAAPGYDDRFFERQDPRNGATYFYSPASRGYTPPPLPVETVPVVVEARRSNARTTKESNAVQSLNDTKRGISGADESKLVESKVDRRQSRDARRAERRKRVLAYVKDILRNVNEPKLDV